MHGVYTGGGAKVKQLIAYIVQNPRMISAIFSNGRKYLDGYLGGGASDRREISQDGRAVFRTCILFSWPYL